MTLQKGKEFLISFFKNNFEITSTKVSKIVGAVLSGVLLLTVILDYKAYTSQEFKQKWILLASVLVFPFIIGLVTAYKIEIKNKTCRKILYLASIFLLPVIS
ncbi:MAG: hypothetical protein II802_00675, partial [Clostridia bacterium]|nr:hypothetical protein [Clostridia bacterium]